MDQQSDVVQGRRQMLGMSVVLSVVMRRMFLTIEVEDDVQDNEKSRKPVEEKAIWSSPGITYRLIIKILCVYNKLN